MKVTIIGAGNVGKALGTSISRAGHDVTITAKHPEHAQEAAMEIGAHPVDSSAEAVSDADVVILAVPYVGAADEVSGEIRDRVAGKTIIDVTNPMKPDYSGLATEGTSAAEEFQKLLPEAKLVKAFNTIFASNQAHPSRRHRRLRRRRRRGCEAAGHVACRVDRLQAGRRRPAEGRSLPRGDGGHQHRPERPEWMGLDVSLEAGALTRCQSHDSTMPCSSSATPMRPRSSIDPRSDSRS